MDDVKAYCLASLVADLNENTSQTKDTDGWTRKEFTFLMKDALARQAFKSSTHQEDLIGSLQVLETQLDPLIH
jgi:hypothetical protein